MHFTRKCNLQCPFCYRNRSTSSIEKPRSFFIELVKYAAEIAPQIALGGGEPLTDPSFLEDMGLECHERGIILNVTTNGKEILSMSPEMIKKVFENITMVSVSLDKHKWPDIKMYAKVIDKLRSASHVKIGTNLLVDESMFESKGKKLFMVVSWLLRCAKVDSVYALYPKNVPFKVDMESCKDIYRALSTIYPSFYVDDLTKEIIEQGYHDWTLPCHHGKDIISVDESGGVSGCSFDEEPAFTINDPRDILHASTFPFEERMACPYLVGE